MNNSFYTSEELDSFGFKQIGQNVLISRKASIYSPRLMEIGNNVRIDDFCILSGTLKLGSYIHISAFTALYGKFGIELHDFTTISGRVMIYSQNDDYSGEFMTNPMVPEKFTKVTGGIVIIEKHAIIGSGSVVLPNITIHEGVAVGAMSLVNKSLAAWGIYAGIPVKFLKSRKMDLLTYENDF